MAERSLRIEAFRNIGFRDGKTWRERLVLNNSLEKGKLGDLIILIGANNSGKSNVLDALNIFGNGNLSERDVTDLFYEEDLHNPKLTLFSRDGFNDKEDEFAYPKSFKDSESLSAQTQDQNIITDDTADEYSYIYLTKKNIFNVLFNLIRSFNDYFPGENKFKAIGEKFKDKIVKFLHDDEVAHDEYASGDYTPFYIYTFDQLIEYLDNHFSMLNSFNSWFRSGTIEFSDSEFEAAAECILEVLLNFKQKDEYRDEWEKYKYQSSKDYDQGIFKELENYEEFSKRKQPSHTPAHQKYEEKYGYNFMPNIIPYKNEDYCNRDLNTDYEQITQNKFFISLFNSIDMDMQTVLNAYHSFLNQNNKGILLQLKKNINDKLKVVSDKFNKLFHLANEPYYFEIDLESNAIFFSIFRGESTISLERQSTGFRWFFNLFFNLLNSTELNSGDIIIMDEPATNLHVKGQRELRAFLKEFAINNDITIVIATHSPFLIDLDYLDEIRIVANEDNVSRIENIFSAAAVDEPDSLLPVKESLTVESHILMNPQNKVVFVEGITDYNYLTAFKKMLGEMAESFVFLPINGVGKTEADCKKISQKLKAIRSDAAILVDGDEAGKRIKAVNVNSDFTILSLNDVDSNFKTIESLFAREDLEKTSLLDENKRFVKHASTSTVFKNQTLKNKNLISETTKENFKKLFEKLNEELS